jgi:hypothetical protein
VVPVRSVALAPLAGVCDVTLIVSTEYLFYSLNQGNRSI